jgi:hypothetical protein
MSRTVAFFAIAAIAASGLAGCQKEVAAPTNTGVCWQAIPLKNGQVKFNQVSVHEPNLEACAGSLEGMRERFEALGGAEEIMGAYQGNYLFLQNQGIFVSQTLTGARYIALVRTDDGRLARPGVMPTQ